MERFKENLMGDIPLFRTVIMLEVGVGISALVWITYGAVGAGFVFLYGCMVFVVANGSRTIRNQQSALKKANVELQEIADGLARSNAELRQFAYVASHDLQEPLRMVASYCQLLDRRYAEKLDRDGREFIAYAVDGANRMQGLINDLLAYSRLGTLGSRFQPVDIREVLDGVLVDLKAVIDDSDATVTSGHLPTVNADAAQMRQLFQNLTGNAIKYHGNRPARVHVEALREDGVWQFSVRDEGIGIESEYTDRIFGLFERLHGHEEYPGTGIGLAMAKKIVERHGGRIWVESQPGEGSTFYFTIPARGVQEFEEASAYGDSQRSQSH